MYLYIPNGYRDLKGTRIRPGIYTVSDDSIAPHVNAITLSKRGYMVNASGAFVDNEKPIIVEYNNMLTTLRHQYTVLTRIKWQDDWTSQDLITRILEAQGVHESEAQAVDSLDSMDLDALRAHYTELAGKKVYYGWDENTLRQKIEDLLADG